jgi:hypothetical protein
MFGICLSLCANVVAAPELSVFAVAARPPLALLLSVELLKRHRAQTDIEAVEKANGRQGRVGGVSYGGLGRDWRQCFLDLNGLILK